MKNIIDCKDVEITQLGNKQLIALHTFKKALVQNLKEELDQIVEEIEKRAHDEKVDPIEFYTKNV